MANTKFNWLLRILLSVLALGVIASFLNSPKLEKQGAVDLQTIEMRIEDISAVLEVTYPQKIICDNKNKYDLKIQVKYLSGKAPAIAFFGPLNAYEKNGTVWQSDQLGGVQLNPGESKTVEKKFSVTSFAEYCEVDIKCHPYQLQEDNSLGTWPKTAMQQQRLKIELASGFTSGKPTATVEK